MKKIVFLLILSIGLLACGCGKKLEDNSDLLKYKNEMTSFFDDLEEMDTEIQKINPESSDSVEKLLNAFDALENDFKKLANIEVPEDFPYNKTLADDAYSYMQQANEYMTQAFEDNDFKQNVFDAAMECYKRANKRVKYIITFLHGETPDDENISFE